MKYESATADKRTILRVGDGGLADYWAIPRLRDCGKMFPNLPQNCFIAIKRDFSPLEQVGATFDLRELTSLEK